LLEKRPFLFVNFNIVIYNLCDRISLKGSDKMIKHIHELIEYGISKEIIKGADKKYIYNQLLYFFKLDHVEFNQKVKKIKSPDEAIFPLLDNLYERGIIDNKSVQYKDLLSSKVMNILADKPSVIIEKFFKLAENKFSDATDWYYKYMQDIDYIKAKRIEKNIFFEVESQYGKIGITINVSRPEKDSKMIAEALKQKTTNYPLCVLCLENEGFAGNLNRDSRDTIRLIPFDINGETWYLQYSPYTYYNEHAVMLSEEHRPMIINRKTFSNLLEMVDKVDGYFFGSNADLPIVGGSILSHDHYQGGKYKFPIENAKVLFKTNYKDVVVEVVEWPLSTIRLKSKNKLSLVDLSDKFLNNWIKYNNESINLFAHTKERHNTITPIARKKNGLFEMDLVLRNNFTNDDYPLGLYHPKEDVWPIKKENIGLIEVMGLAVLPGRLVKELKGLADALSGGNIPKGFEKFFNEIKETYKGEPPLEYVYNKAGLKFVKGLEDCKVLPEKYLIEFTEEVIK
jgi:UDPglucose--hexose-1-phosphate uridylyltransferase